MDLDDLLEAFDAKRGAVTLMSSSTLRMKRRPSSGSISIAISPLSRKAFELVNRQIN
jgi:hypothetical protein